MKLKILVVDDHALIRKGVTLVLRRHDPEWEVWEASNGVQALLKINDLKPDVVLMDFFMPKLDGLNTSVALLKELPDAKIILISMDMTEEVVVSMISAGIRGIVPKDAPEQELIDAIRTVSDGSYYMPGRFGDLFISLMQSRLRQPKVRKDGNNDLFSSREKEIIRLIGKGYSTEEISAFLSISRRTVENHKMSLLRKANVHNMVSFLRYAKINGLLTGDSSMFPEAE